MDICIPIPDFAEEKIANVVVMIGEGKTEFQFRIVSFPWNCSEDKRLEVQISGLKKEINNYSKDWELIQIFNPAPGSKFIRVLYRKKH
jgi:hypothetical protein